MPREAKIPSCRAIRLLAAATLPLIFIGCARGELPIRAELARECRPACIIRHAGHIWVAAKFGGAFAVEAPSGKKPAIARELKLEGAQRRTHWLAVFRGDIWIATEGGLVRYSPEKGKIVSVITEKNGLPTNSVRWVGKIGGALWAGTIRGACRMEPGGQWTLYGTDQGLPSEHVYKMIFDHGTIWASCIAGGLAAWDPGSDRWRMIPFEQGLGNKYIYSMAEGGSGVWLGTAGGINLYVPGKARWDEAVCSDGFTDYCVYSVAESGGDLWFATNYGLYRRRLKDGRQWIYGAGQGLPSNEVSALYAEPDGLWAGTAKGLILIDTGEL